MADPSQVRLIPDCRVSVDGKKLDTEKDAALTRVEIDLDVDLFGQCTLIFNDPQQKLINGKDFESGTAVKVEIGFASKLQKVFEGEVVALEPQFRRDSPPSLRVVCQESLHRLALSQMTRAFNDVDDKEIANKIAQEHGLSADAPSGTKEHILQGNVTDATFLRRLAQKHGNHLRIEGKKLIIGPPPSGANITVKPGDGLRKIKVRVQSNTQVEEISVHGYDPKTKQEFVGKAKGTGVVGEGTQKYGKGKTLSFAGHEHQPADQATAEAMAKGRMRKIAEGHVVATMETIGNPSMIPGATVKLEKMGAQIDGSYRVEKAVHHFSKHGYYVTMKAVRVAKAAPPPAPPPAAAPGRPPPAPAPQAQQPAPGAQPAPVPPASGANGAAAAGGAAAPAAGGAAGGAAAAATGGTAATAATGGTAAAAATGAAAGPAANTSIAFRFDPAQGYCGDRIHIRADTQNLADGTAVTITLRPRQGSSPRLAAVNATVNGNHIDQEFVIANVDFGTGGSIVTQVDVEATSTNAATVTCATPLQVRGRSDGASAHYDVHRTWGATNQFAGHPRFDQRVVRFRNMVAITADVMKCWGATYLDLTRAHVAGGVGGCYAGHVWGRNTSPTGGMSPNEYYDGSAWVALPAGFVPSAAEFFSVAFYQDSGAYTTGVAGLTFPDAFANYDFNSTAYTNVRNHWCQLVHDYWTEKWALRRHTCTSEVSVHCCRYEVEVNLTFNTVTTKDADTILIGPGNYRSNMSTFFMDDPDAGMVPHEIGHLMDNPDEYEFGAIDASINGDGAVNGIDAASIMGQSMTTVKQRHYHAFALMLQRIMNTAYRNNDPFDTVAR